MQPYSPVAETASTLGQPCLAGASTHTLVLVLHTASAVRSFAALADSAHHGQGSWGGGPRPWAAFVSALMYTRARERTASRFSSRHFSSVSTSVIATGATRSIVPNWLKRPPNFATLRFCASRRCWRFRTVRSLPPFRIGPGTTPACIMPCGPAALCKSSAPGRNACGCVQYEWSTCM
eukprot:5522018-Prymnesium_polylepis.1